MCMNVPEIKVIYGDSDPLFDLVKAMTKSEKRNFKLYAKRIQKKGDDKLLFVQLFDVLDKMNEYEEPLVLKKIKVKKGSQLANLKRHLYKQVMTSLRLIHISKNIDIQIREQIDFARILYGKGLYRQSLRLLEKIKEIASKHHQDILHLEIVEFQKLIEERHITRSRSIKNKMENLVSESERRAEVNLSACTLSNLKIDIHGHYIKYGHVKNSKDTEIVQLIFDNALNKIQRENMSFFERVYFEQSKVWYHYILLNFPLCYRAAANWVRLFDDNPKIKAEDPDLYMRGIYYVLTCLFYMNSYDRFIEYYEKLEEFVSQHKKELKELSQMLAFLYLNNTKLNKYYLEGDFEAGVATVPYILENLKKYKLLLDTHRILVFYYKISYMYVGAEKYDQALDYLNAIINLKAGHLRGDIQCYARLMRLLIHYEKGHYDFISYEVDAVQRFMEKTEAFSQLPRAILRFLKQLIKTPVADHKRMFEVFKKELEILKEDYYEKRSFWYLDMLMWVESRLRGVPLKVVMQEQLRK